MAEGVYEDGSVGGGASHERAEDEIVEPGLVASESSKGLGELGE